MSSNTSNLLLKFLTKSIFIPPSCAIYLSYLFLNNNGLAFLNLYILCLISPTIYTLLLLIKFIKLSCKSLVSWYSSTHISLKLFISSSLTSLLFLTILIAIILISLNSYLLILLLYLFILISNSLIIFIIAST